MPRKAPAQPGDEFARHERNQEEILWLQDFVFNTAKVPFPTILLVGKRFSGKSYTSVSIAAKFEVPRWAAWCGTKDTEDFWAERFDSNATVKGPDEKGKTYLINVIRYQQRKGRLYKKILKQPFPRKFTVGLVFDDVTSKREFRKGEILEDLFSNGRHYHAVIVISAQYLKQLPPAVRLNTDYMFMMHNTKRTIKVLYEDYVEEPDEFGMFLDLIRSVTGQKDSQGIDLYNALVYDNVNKTQKLEEIFKIYRNEGEKYLDDVKLGDQSWREYNKAHYKDEDHELQLREHRKQQRMYRLRQYREQQMIRQTQPSTFDSALGPGDVDFYDDTDSEDEKEQASRHDTVTLQHRSGSAVKINFLKRATTATPTLSTHSSSLPPQQPSGGIDQYAAFPGYQAPLFASHHHHQVAPPPPSMFSSPPPPQYQQQYQQQQLPYQPPPQYPTTPWGASAAAPGVGYAPAPQWSAAPPATPMWHQGSHHSGGYSHVDAYKPAAPMWSSSHTPQPQDWSAQQDFVRRNSVYSLPPTGGANRLFL